MELEKQNRALREARGSLEESRNRYADLFDFAPVACFTFDTEGCVIEVNLAGATIVGQDRSRLIGVPFVALVEMVDPALLRQHLQDCSDTRGPVVAELSFEAAAGLMYVQAMSVPVYDATGRAVAFHTALTDIGALKRENLRLTLLSDLTKDIAGSLDLDVILKAVARSVVPCLADHCAAYWQTDDRVLPVVWTHANPSDECFSRDNRIDSDDKLSLVAEVARTRRSMVVAEAASARDQVLREMARDVPLSSTMIVPIGCHNGTGVLMFIASSSGRHYDGNDLALADEIAKRVALAIANARLYDEAQAAIRSRDNLLAVVSHDLRSPLNAVSLSAGLLLRGPDSGERTMKQSLLIRRSAQRMNRLIEDLLTATTIEAGRFTVARSRTSVCDLIEEAHAMTEPELATKSLRIERRGNPPLCDVMCDRERILQVFANILGNAIKFTPHGGTIGLYAAPDVNMVLFAVSDTGPGIAEVQRPHLFDRYWKGHANERHSVGLGLYIAKGIVDAHGGNMWVESKAGEGSTFFFTLPSLDDGDAAD